MSTSSAHHPTPPLDLGRELTGTPAPSGPPADARRPAASSSATRTTNGDDDDDGDARPTPGGASTPRSASSARPATTPAAAPGDDHDVRSSSASSADNDDGPSTPGSAREDEAESFLATELKAEQKLLAARSLAPHRPPLALALNGLSVRGAGGSGVSFAPDVGSTFAPWSGAQDKRRLRKLERAKGMDGAEKGENEKREGDDKLKDGEKFLIRDVSLVLHPSELLLVVGRPGAGCTTLLKALAGLTQGFAGVDGEVLYGAMHAGGKGTRAYDGAVCFNSEEDVHFPNLSVRNTLDFAFAQKTPAPSARPPAASAPDGPPLSTKAYNAQAKARLLKVFGLEHTEDTPVGDAYVRGVSGGEKKRVSIAEVLANRASIEAWDNATRGLDSNTALSFIKTLRTYADLERKVAAVSLYQAGNAIYEQFDKVLVLAEGEVIYYGRREAAKAYFEELGFEAIEGANIADFMTGTTSAQERRVRDGFEHKAPTTVADFARRYRESDTCRAMRAEMDAHLGRMADVERETHDAQRALQDEKHKGAIRREPHVRGLWAQTMIALRRERQQRWGDQWTFWARQGTTFIQAFVVGSLFYNMQTTTSDIFLRGGTIYLSLLFPSLISLSETTAAFEGRGVLAKHKAFSMYRPSAVFLAQTIADLPVFAVQTVIFSTIIYFLANLKQTASGFFIYLLFVFSTTVCTTAFFRLVGSSFGTFQNASKVSGFMFSVWVTYAGYIIQSPQMKPWFAWIRYINPIFYAFEAVMASEFSGTDFECSADMTVPAGQAYTTGQNAGCAMAGSTPGSTTIAGTDYISQALRFSYGHVFRNFGVICAYWFLFCLLNVIMFERLPAAGSGSSVLLYKRGGGKKFIKQQGGGDGADDAADASSDSSQTVAERQSTRDGAGDAQEKAGKKEGEVEAADAVFTWKDLTYTVGNGIKLLDNVSGYCKAGELTALMGSSGAGKTTLQDVLAGRKDTGEIKGEVLFQGRPLPISFTRTTGYCEQQDVHLPQATVREALEFSARLRQPRTTPDKDRIAYVDEIIELLELHDIEDAMIGVPGAGLGIEQRKRLTIAVELVSKPSILFLDEPTSGLDGQSSFTIVKFLRKLAESGQTILAVIHQPSASLFAEFDNVLLLKKGGRVAYFGAVDGLPDYFGKHGAKFPKGSNPAEAMIDVLEDAEDVDWAVKWSESDESKEAMKELERLKEAGSKKDVHHEGDGDEYASTTAMQLRLVTQRATIQLWRDTDYVTNKIALHVFSALFNGFSFWMIGDSYGDLQLRLFTIFQFVFVAPGVIAQTQPKFIANRDVFETREKKARIYSYKAFILGEITAEFPYLLVCAFLYWACWYAVVGFSFRAEVVGPVFLTMVLYELLYTGIGQAIAAYAPSATFAALVNPLVISVLVTFSGVLVPFPQITAFWRYWLYYLDPFSYLLGGLLVFPIWDVQVQCKESEMAIFDPPTGSTCGGYLQSYLAASPPGYLDNPDATSACMYCPTAMGSEYLAQRNLARHIFGWRDICITFLFVLSSYSLVFLLMKLRSKKTKSASSN